MNNLSEIVISNEDIVRFAILFGDSDASSFKTNLSKMIELILYQEHPNSMSIVDIITKIKELYLMEFTEEEVKSVIHDNKKGKFEISQNSRNYELTPKAFQAIQERYTRKDISLMIKRFYDEHSEFAELGLQAVEDIIKKYIFLKFNKDAKTLKWILTLDVNQVYEEDRIEDFNEIEKEVLNSFFSWENEEKNVLVYEIISSALQYCKMTTRKENAISNSIFRGKTFYLDLNIIFRLAGFNLAERQEVTGSFIRKCKECGIKIKYTNFTKAELDWTLDSSVEGIKKYTSGKAPIGKEAMHMLKPKMRNKDLYYVYSDWAKDTVNHRYYDFKEFRRYLDRRVEDVLRGLGKVKKLTKKQKKNIGKNFRKQGKQNSGASPIMLLHTGNRQEGGTNYIPFQRMSQRRSDLKAIKTVSMPQMVSNDVVKENIEKTLSTEMGKRIDHHMKR